MLASVVAHMAPLAERSEVARSVVAGIVVQVRAGEHDARDPQRGGRVDAGEARLRACQLHRCGQTANPPALPVAPACGVLVPPHPIAEMQHVAAVRATAMLAAPLGAAEADKGRQLAPVDRVKPAMFARDRHDDSMSHDRAERKQKIRCIYLSSGKRLSCDPARRFCLGGSMTTLTRKWRAFDRTVEEVRAKFADLSPAKLEALIDEAVAATRQSAEREGGRLPPSLS